MTRKTYVFKDTVLIGEYAGKPPKFSMPVGSYVCSDTKNWYIKMRASLVPINYCDIPKEIKTLCLLLEISI